MQARTTSGLRGGALLLALLACGCAGDGSNGPAKLRPAAADAQANKNDELQSLGDDPRTSRGLYSDLIRNMLAQEQYYAALAHIEQQQGSDGSSDELRFLEAETRRHLGQVVESDKLYRKLLRSDYAAQSYRGLGLLHAARNLPAATEFLREAVERQPTNADMRNDLGYALMSAGRYREALPEIATAVELDRDSAKARNNLIILLVLAGDEAGVKRVAEAGGVGTQALSALRKQARTLSTRIAAKRGVP
ncbi:MAG TPA: tetratricopeptide repeat protein [Solimonas sp.]|nr:tetratricopeptide repeat protein [Solimonas sp.]